ncbi:hypothetical protein [Nitrosopumilus sp. SJ]|uniref:hypothetical protein n=1 Tax=Nitrosopumilus sp. SJ TaxID=1027374 RepID=UPI000371F14C|nr:hypothetical protein [Nitrosopumilus sp. SJ]
MNIKSEKSIKEYLKTLPDDTIIKYYLDVEFSPFPVLLIEEYTRRFKRKTKDEIIKDIKFQTHLAKKKTQDLTRLARKRIAIDDITKQKSEEFISQAQKKGHKISDNILKKSGILGSKLKKGTRLGIKKELPQAKIFLLLLQTSWNC